MGTHWHANYYEQSETYWDFWAALQFIRDELRIMVDSTYEYIGILGEAEQWREAYESFVKFERLENILINLDQLIKQRGQKRIDRAPFYRDCQSTLESNRQLYLAVEHVLADACFPRELYIEDCDRSDCQPEAVNYNEWS